MELIIISIVLLVTLLVVLSKYGHTIWASLLQKKAYNGEKKLDEADDRRYKTIFFLFGLGMSLMLCFLTFELLFNHIIPDNFDKEIIERIEADLEEIPIIDLPPPPPPTQIVEPIVEESEEPILEEPDPFEEDTTEIAPPTLVISDDYPEEEPAEEVIDNTIYGFGQVHKNASFRGGKNEMIKFLSTNLNYPLYELQEGISGTVYVMIVVEKDGKISGSKIVKAVVSDALNKEALRLVNSMPRWEPAETKDGIFVRQRLNLPIRFSIED